MSGAPLGIDSSGSRCKRSLAGVGNSGPMQRDTRRRTWRARRVPGAAQRERIHKRFTFRDAHARGGVGRLIWSTRPVGARTDVSFDLPDCIGVNPRS